MLLSAQGCRESAELAVHFAVEKQHQVGLGPSTLRDSRVARPQKPMANKHRPLHHALEMQVDCAELPTNIHQWWSNALPTIIAMEEAARQTKDCTSRIGVALARAKNLPTNAEPCLTV